MPLRSDSLSPVPEIVLDSSVCFSLLKLPHWSTQTFPESDRPGHNLHYPSVFFLGHVQGTTQRPPFGFATRSPRSFLALCLYALALFLPIVAPERFGLAPVSRVTSFGYQTTTRAFLGKPCLCFPFGGSAVPVHIRCNFP